MKVLVIEDQPSLLDAISVHLKRGGFVVDGASTLRSAKSLVKASKYDGIFLDLALPDGSGLDFLRDLRQSGFKTPVIVMTARDQVSDRIMGLEAGADDYVVKPFDLDEVTARFHAVLRRYQGSSSSVVQIGVFKIDKVGHRLLKADQEVPLTAKEWAVVERLTRHRDAVVSKEDLEETLFSIDDDVMSNTLEVHISRIRKKIGKHHIETLRNLGYRFAGKGADE
jgi:DNA-binding response OmpR family regulator